MITKIRSRSARFTPLDRFAVQLWLATSALLTARRMLKRAEQRETLDRVIQEIEAFRAGLGRRDLWADAGREEP